MQTVDLFIDSIEWGDNRAVLVHRREHGGRIYVRFRTWNRHKTKGVWYPSPRFFAVPLDCAAGLAEAIAAGALRKQLGPEPDWYAEFEKQYEARMREKTAFDTE